MFPTRPELNWSAKEGLNGRNYMIRVDHQLNANNTYTARYLTERQPNRDLLTGDRATLSTANYELDIDQTASVAYNRVIGTTALNTLRASIETEDIQRGAEPGDFLETNRKDLEPPVLRFLSFDEQGHTNGQHRNAQAPGLDNTFSLFVPGKGGDHDLKFGFQYLYAQERAVRTRQHERRVLVSGRSSVQCGRSLDLPGTAVDSRARSGRRDLVHPFLRVLRAGQVANHAEADAEPWTALRRRHLSVLVSR